MPFDSEKRVKEFHEIADTLTKIRNGRFDVIQQDVFGGAGEEATHVDGGGGFGTSDRFDLN